jgi:hypothetical protein
MKRIPLKPFKVVAVNLLLLFLLLEIVSVGFYFFRTGKVFYSTNKSQDTTTTAEPENDSGDAPLNNSIDHRLHPYFGFVYDKHATRRLQFSRVNYSANNFGILSPYDYPVKKTNGDQFIIGIFGGSVGMYFGFYELENHVLANALKRLPYFQNKQIIVLPFAMGAFKQPQQLLALSYFLSIGQEFDMVINIDGFNETALSYVNNRSGIELSMPNIEILGPMIALANRDLSLNELSLTLEILKLKSELKETRVSLNKCRLAICYTFRWIQLQFLLNQYRKKVETFNALKRDDKESDSLVHLNRNGRPLDDPEALGQIADVWANSTLAIDGLLRKKGIAYFHVIQPNQYYSTARKFSEAEKKIALSSSGRYAEGVSKGYPKLIAKIGELERSGINVINASNVFDEVSDPVYEDDCCHYNKVGNEVLANYVARNIVMLLSSARSQ